MHHDARIYDLETTGFVADLPYWSALLDQSNPTTVLDLACGTGRITLPLAEQGVRDNPAFQLVGLDISQPLLARARERLGEACPAVQGAVSFVEADMRSFCLDTQFDLIVLGFNSLAYVYDMEDQLGCLDAVRRHLAPGGRFAIDLLVPNLGFLDEAQVGGPVRLEVDLRSPEPGIRQFLRTATERYDVTTQRDDTLYFYEIYHEDGRHERFTDDLAWHMYFPRELELLLRIAGLRVVERFGNYARAPFGHRSTQYLWVMEAMAPRECQHQR